MQNIFINGLIEKNILRKMYNFIRFNIVWSSSGHVLQRPDGSASTGSVIMLGLF